MIIKYLTTTKTFVSEVSDVGQIHPEGNIIGHDRSAQVQLCFKNKTNMHRIRALHFNAL